MILTSRPAQMTVLALLALAAAAVLAANPPPVERLRQHTFDSYNRLLPRKPGNDIVIVGIGEDSVNRLGQWPWGRDVMAKLADTLHAMGPKSVTFDLIFQAPDRTVQAAQPGGTTSNDAAFAKKIRQAGNIVLGSAIGNAAPEARERVGTVPVAYRGADAADLDPYLFPGEYFIKALPPLRAAAAGDGHVNFVPEDDGLIRRLPMMLRHTDAAGKTVALYPSLSLAALRAALGIKTPYEVVGAAGQGIEKIVLGSYSIPTDEDRAALLYYAGHKTREFIPAWQVVEKKIDPALIKDKIVFIGISSPNIGDVRSTPLDAFLQGTEIHAEMTDQILRGQFLRRPSAAAFGEAAAALVISLLVIWLAQEMNALLLAGGLGVLFAASAFGGLAAFGRFGLLIDPVGPSAVISVVFVLASILASLRTKMISNEKSRFLALMSHEIRTPMTGIMGMIEFMKDESLTAAEREGFLNTISECSKTLLNTLNDVLDVSKLEEGKLEISNINFDLYAVLNNSAEVLSRMARNKGIALSVLIDANVPQQVHGDPHRLQQIVMNLMNNAIKFTSKGGVTVHCALRPCLQSRPLLPLPALRGERAGVRGRATKAAFGSCVPSPHPNPLPAKCGERELKGAFLRVEVRDTGIGISEKNMKKLFKGFSQADNSIARKFGGTGLGLSIAKDLLHLMGGKVGVDSRLGEGSTFWFELPYVPPVSTAAVEEENVELAPLSILLAEDNKVTQQVAVRLLTNKGHKVAIADDGETVVKMAQERDFDMILMDMNMPLKSGIDAAREIRALGGAYKTLPIIALTANVVDEYVKKCYAAGMNAHVAKPFSPKELYAVMARLAPPEKIMAASRHDAAPEPAGEKLNDNLREIRRQLGAEYLNELIKNSLKEAARLLKAARDAHAADDPAALGNAAHDLKNVTGLISLEETNHLAEIIETLCRKNELTALPDMMKALARDGEREIRRMEKARGLA